MEIWTITPSAQQGLENKICNGLVIFLLRAARSKWKFVESI
jgi:ornithine lipid ester-linked acyl 2-hydroxylase